MAQIYTWPGNSRASSNLLYTQSPSSTSGKRPSTQSYVYDAANRLIASAQADPDAIQANRYAYDASGSPRFRAVYLTGGLQLHQIGSIPCLARALAQASSPIPIGARIPNSRHGAGRHS